MTEDQLKGLLEAVLDQVRTPPKMMIKSWAFLRFSSNKTCPLKGSDLQRGSSWGRPAFGSDNLLILPR